MMSCIHLQNIDKHSPNDDHCPLYNNLFGIFYNHRFVQLEMHPSRSFSGTWLWNGRKKELWTFLWKIIDSFCIKFFTYIYMSLFGKMLDFLRHQCLHMADDNWLLYVVHERASQHILDLCENCTGNNLMHQLKTTQRVQKHNIVFRKINIFR